MKNKITVIALLLFAFITIMAGCSSKESAFAGSYRDLTYEAVYGATAGEQSVKVYVDPELYQYLEKITYDVVTTEGSEIINEGLRPFAHEGSVDEEGITVEKDNAVVTPESLTQSGNRYYFTVSNNHCCAFIFTVYIGKGEGEDTEIYYDSPILYLKNIDTEPPRLSELSYDYLNKKYVLNCVFADDAVNCYNSGVKSFIVYRVNEANEEEIWLESDKITARKTSFELEEGKYKYYITLKDAVGNTSEKKLIADFDVDELIRKSTAALNTIDSAPELWSETFRLKLERALSAYEVARNNISGLSTAEELQNASDDLSAVISEYNTYVIKMLGNKRNVDARVNNADYLPGGLSTDSENLYAACDFIRYGEEGVLTVSVAKYLYKDIQREEEMTQAGMEKADDVYAFSVQTIASEQGEIQSDFGVPLKLSLSLGDYKHIAAVQVTEEGEKTICDCRVTEYTDGTIVLNVKKTYGTVYLFVEKEQKFDYRWLYLLFLLIPVSAGVACLIIIGKKKRRK